MRKAIISIHHPDELTVKVEDYCGQTYPSFIQCTFETEAVKIDFYFDSIDDVEGLAGQLANYAYVIRERQKGAPEES